MLRKRKYDHVGLGLNFLSLLSGLKDLKQSKSSLIIDDQNININDFEWKFLTYFDFFNLNSFLKNLNIETKPYVKAKKHNFIFSNKLITLGDMSPWKNLVELSRRLPEIFTESFINEEIFDNELIKLGKLYLNSSEKLLKALKEKNELNQFIKSSAALLGKEEYSYAKQILAPYSYYSAFDKKEELDLILLVLKALLPSFKLDIDKLYFDLLERYKALGGDIIESEVKTISKSAHHRGIRIVELSSFEGKISCHKFASYGGKKEFGINAKEDDKFKSWEAICLVANADSKFFHLEDFICFNDMGSVIQNYFGPIFAHKESNQIYFYSFYRPGFGQNNLPIQKEFYRYLEIVLKNTISIELGPLDKLEFLRVLDQLSFTHNSKKISFQNQDDHFSQLNIAYKGSFLSRPLGKMQQIHS